MEILFIDESKPPTDKDKITSSNELFVLSGLIIPDYSWKELNSSFYDLLKKYGVTGEIKWRYFVPKNKDKGNSLLHLDQTKRNSLRIEILKLLGENNDIKIISVVCNLPKTYNYYSYIKNKTDVYDFCYKTLIDRFQYYLQDKSKKTTNKHLGIIVCDHRDKQDDIHLRQTHETILKGEKSYFSSIENIIETIFFVPSDKSTGIQLVDMIAGSIFRYISSKDDNFYKHIKPIIRRDDKGKAEGYGIALLPPNHNIS